MKAKHVDFGSIEAFKNVIQSITHTSRFAGVDEAGQVIYNNDPLPILQFTGTVKIHGTNAGISMLNGELYAQKRSSIVTEGHFGFPEYVIAYSQELKDLFHFLFGELETDVIYTIFGEWAGCFRHSTPIRLANGGKMNIGKIVNERQQVEVLSYNESTGKLEPRKVIGWHNNGRKDNWVEIVVQRRKRGGRGTSIVVTGNHILFVRENGEIKEKKAADITTSDVLLFVGKCLNYNILQFLKGTILGDGSFAEKRSIQVSHSEKQSFYIDFIRKVLGNVIVSEKDTISGHGSKMKVLTTYAFPEIEDIQAELFGTDPTNKCPTKKYLDSLSPLALAAWYMDDGSLNNHPRRGTQAKATLYVQGFGKEGVVLVKNWLDSRGFFCNFIRQRNDKWAIRMTPEGTCAFLHTIAPYVIPEFNYKMPEDFWPIEKISWWEHRVNEYDQALIDTRVERVGLYTNTSKTGSVGYDITIEGNSNYFANNVLVHNSGIQKGIGISNIKEKSFFLFGTSISRWVEDKWEKEWCQLLAGSMTLPPRCYSIYEFPTYSIEIDFNMPQLAQNRLIEITNAVEAQCPVAAQLGVEGVGEGVVWTTTYKGNQYRFKVKGEKHSNTKVKTLAEVDDAKLEKIQDAVMYLVAPARLEQALFETQAKEKKDTPEVLRWIANDIIKEESGTLVRNGLEWKDVARAVTDHYRRMWFEKIDKT